MLQLPALLASIVLASIYAALFYLWQGRGFRDLLFFWLAALVGFASGQFVGANWGFIPWTVGQIHLIEASLMALLFLAIARLLRLQGKAEPKK